MITVSVWFMTVIVPVRSEALELGVAVKENDPEPVPLAPALIVIQDVFDTADHTQPLVAVTETAYVPPEGCMAITGPSERV